MYEPFSYAINSGIIWTVSVHGCIQVENKFDILENDLWLYLSRKTKEPLLVLGDSTTVYDIIINIY